MIEFGKTLREAREKKGLTPSQIAEQTHLLPQIVEDLEKEDFHRISAPIYGRGFVKLYCEAVGIDAKPLVDEFMAILNGEREPAIRMKEVALPTEEPIAPPAPEPPKPPVYTQPELGEEPGEEKVEVEGQGQQGTVNLHAEGVRPAEGVRQEIGDRSARRETTDANAQLSAAPMPPPTRQYHPDYASAAPSFGPSLNFGRLAVLAGGAIVVLLVLIFGGRALYRVTMTVPGEEKEAKQSASSDAAGTPRLQEGATASSDKKKTTEAKKTEAKKPEAKKSETKKPEAKKPETKKADSKKPETKKPETKKAPAANAGKTARVPKDVPPLYVD